MTVAETVVDAGECDWCGHGRWAHKLGKRGCKEIGCPCARYEPPKSKPAAEPELIADPASPVPGVLVDRPDDADPGECVGEPLPARPGDVDLVALPANPEPDCCPGEPAYGDPRGLHSADCPVGIAQADALSQIAHPTGPGPTCAYPAGEDQGEHDHALCEDVVAERAELAAAAEIDPADTPGTPEHLRKSARHHAQLRLDEALKHMQPFYDDVLPTIEEAFSWRDQLAAADDLEQRLVGQLNEATAKIGRARDALLAAGVPFEVTDEAGLAGAINRLREVATTAAGEAEEAQRRAQALAGELTFLQREIAAVTGQRDQAVADLERLGTELTAARREAKAAIRARDRIRGELDAATLARLRLQEELDEAILTGLAAATNVLYRYAAWQCETCGNRYGHRADHEHPLTPVDVLVVRKTTKAPAAAGPDTNRTKEN